MWSNRLSLWPDDCLVPSERTLREKVVGMKFVGNVRDAVERLFNFYKEELANGKHWL